MKNILIIITIFITSFANLARAEESKPSAVPVAAVGGCMAGGLAGAVFAGTHNTANFGPIVAGCALVGGMAAGATSIYEHAVDEHDLNDDSVKSLDSDEQ